MAVELAAVYLIMACNQPVAMIVEREIDGRYVSLSQVEGYPIDDSKKQWLLDGVMESVDTNEVYQFEANLDCGAMT